MFVPRHNLYLAGLWLFWTALFLIWGFYPIQVLSWSLVFVAILNILATGYILGIAKYRQTKHHPLFDQIPEEKSVGEQLPQTQPDPMDQQPEQESAPYEQEVTAVQIKKTPGNPAKKRKEYELSWRKGKKVYELMAPLRDGRGLSWDEIKAKVETELGNAYPSSTDSLRGIYNKGKRGDYDSFEKFLENS